MTADPMTRQCTATAKSTGRRCTHRPMRGQRVCRHHGGSAPQAKAAVERRDERDEAERAVQTYGLPRDIAPDEALLEEVHRTAGHVAYLGALVGDLDRRGLKQYATGESGAMFERPSVWVELYQKERAHLVQVCRAALAAGLAERQVQLAERQGELVGRLLRVAIEAMGASGEQQQRAYDAVRRHLTPVS